MSFGNQRRHQGDRCEHTGQAQVQSRSGGLAPAGGDQLADLEADDRRQDQEVGQVRQKHDSQPRRGRTVATPGKCDRGCRRQDGPKQDEAENKFAAQPAWYLTAGALLLHRRGNRTQIGHVASCKPLSGGPGFVGSTVAKLHQFLAPCDRNVKLSDPFSQRIPVDTQQFSGAKLVSPGRRQGQRDQWQFHFAQDSVVEAGRREALAVHVEIPLQVQLYRSAMLSSGAMTNRIDRLEQKGLVRRLPSQEDRRSLKVQLTEDGLALIDRAVAAHVANERTMMAPLGEAEQAQLKSLLGKWLAAHEDR